MFEILCTTQKKASMHTVVVSTVHACVHTQEVEDVYEGIWILVYNIICFIIIKIIFYTYYRTTCTTASQPVQV